MRIGVILRNEDYEKCLDKDGWFSDRRATNVAKRKRKLNGVYNVEFQHGQSDVHGPSVCVWFS